MSYLFQRLQAAPGIYVRLFFLVVLYTGCQTKNNDKNYLPIIETGSARLYRYEWQKQVRSFADNYQRRYHKQPPKDSLIAAADNFMDYSYILAGAYENGYAEMPLIEKKVQVASKYIMCQRKGLLYKNLIASKVHITDSDIAEALTKSRKLYTVSMLEFKDRETLLRILGSDTLLKDSTHFNAAVKKSRNDKDIKFTTVDIRIPSRSFTMLQDKISQMKEGEISGPQTVFKDPFNTAVYILYKKKVSNLAPNNAYKMNVIERILRSVEEEKLYVNYLHKILDISRYKADKTWVNEVFSRIKYGEHIIIDKTSFGDTLKRPLVSYRVNNINVIVSVNDAIEYFNQMPVRQRIKTGEEFDGFLKGIAITDLLYQEATRMNLTNTAEFMASQHNFRNRIIAETFEKETLFKDIRVKDKELEEVYIKQRSRYSMPDSVQVSIFTFKVMKDALYSTKRLQRINTTEIQAGKLDTSTIKGLKKYALHAAVSFSDSKYPQWITHRLFNMPEQKISEPFVVDGEILLFKKEKSIGSRTRTLEEVSNEIKKKLLAEQQSLILKDYLVSAKKKYTLKSYFSDNDYAMP